MAGFSFLPASSLTRDEWQRTISTSGKVEKGDKTQSTAEKVPSAMAAKWDEWPQASPHTPLIE